jgi:trehalose-phosphatase
VNEPDAPGHDRPNALDQWDAIAPRFSGSLPAIFADYDGTLTPIAPRPELAALAPDMRELLVRLDKAFPTAIITGRGLADVQHLVGVPHLTYAATHGFDIHGPHVHHQTAPELVPTFEALAVDLAPLVDVPGIVMEAKTVSIAVHYRQVEPALVPDIEAKIDRVLERYPKVKKGRGKLVFELRPTFDWNKGKALEWLLAAFAERWKTPLTPVFLGDDWTDEDALLVVRPRGVGIYVGTPTWDTAARYQLRNSDEVFVFLNRLATEFRRPAHG